MAIIHLAGFQQNMAIVNNHLIRGPIIYEQSLSPASFHPGRCLCCLSSSFGKYIAMFLSLVLAHNFLPKNVDPNLTQLSYLPEALWVVLFNHLDNLPVTCLSIFLSISFRWFVRYQVRQDRNAHDYLADLGSEVPLYMKVKRFPLKKVITTFLIKM